MTSPLVGPLNGWDLFCGLVLLSGAALLLVAYVVMHGERPRYGVTVPSAVFGSVLCGVGLGWWVFRVAACVILNWQAACR